MNNAIYKEESSLRNTMLRAPVLRHLLPVGRIKSSVHSNQLYLTPFNTEMKLTCPSNMWIRKSFLLILGLDDAKTMTYSYTKGTEDQSTMAKSTSYRRQHWWHRSIQTTTLRPTSERKQNYRDRGRVWPEIRAIKMSIVWPEDGRTFVSSSRQLSFCCRC